MNILRNCDSLQYIADNVQKLHPDDENNCKIMILGEISPNVNSKGFHNGIHGGSGKGKSDLATKVKHVTDGEGNILKTSLSPEALFNAYEAGKIRSGIVIFSDDIKLDEEIRTTIKMATTDFNEPLFVI